MTVRELIESLLDYEMDRNVVAELRFGKDWDEMDFEIDDNGVSIKEVNFVIDLGDQVLIDRDRLEELESIESEYESVEE
ncbi:hypothetical protein [Oceanobacillus kimchii]|uniref:Uncharacterized protein n=1 Tax=Oceanobacillus kimchii TaxID=746691 RepID=A0ABQ5TKP4_9BACI|nr:hypothetical protein [Oceanobacillus kimchii]GLO66269.1 hypothetical protein MACH08_20530 [Oceanobacillus kimchii]